MPYIANTPESVLPRADSLNPATTCRGLTSNGRPCRRPLNSSNGSSPAATPPKRVVATVGRGTDPTAFYCWQHKDQAQQATATVIDEKKTGRFQLNPRSSIDTLVDRLGLLEVDEAKIKKRNTNRPGKYSSGPRPRPITFCCFVIGEEEEDLPASKPHSRPTETRPTSANQRPSRVSAPSTPQRPSSGRPSSRPSPASSYQSSQRPPGSSASQAGSLLALIPPNIPTQTASALLAELAKPISAADDEGYIYMFWVTPSTSASKAPPSRELASSLLPPGNNRPHNSRSTSDAIRTAQHISASSRSPNAKSDTIRLKIGRANNVQRRLNEWTRQCSHNLTLIRYYPYTSSSASHSPSPARSSKGRQGASPSPSAGRKVPHVHRVERLIHLELADKRVKNLGPCSECGKEHREWFEVEAHKDALKSVDDCIRRWVGWAESQG
ncbi:hypothetical protein Plec18167_004242 [Paecilomyces lecythidis]|uniref:Bacteriophage T5 Orf172 DNA-binding domain-containing protein n=1 Tax=Paecilomyces lecythidis TaxID=3004212 RepID=A0ABR3XTM4_9EURO